LEAEIIPVNINPTTLKPRRPKRNKTRNILSLKVHASEGISQLTNMKGNKERGNTENKIIPL
jgi:hypothetical protein